MPTPPPKPPPRKRRAYSAEAMTGAIAAVKEQGKTVAAASKEFGVPRITLHDKISGRYSENAPLGRPSLLNAEEEQVLVDWVIAMARAKFPVTKEQLLNSVGRLFKDLKKVNPFSGTVPGETWLALFLKRHPEISKRMSQALVASRANVTEQQIRAWFGEVKEYFNSKGLLQVFDDPARIFNADETAFFLCPKGTKVLAAKGDKSVYHRTGNDDKECVTVLVTANAAGQCAPPMVLFNYERIPANVVANFPDGWGLGKSENGWMTGETFFEFIVNVFHPWLKQTKAVFPVILFIDGHTSHITLHLSKFCAENQIELVALYPNATHILQPMDIAVFHPLKAAWKKSVNEWRVENGARKLKKEEFAPLLKGVLEKTITPDTIANGFKSTGLLKLNADHVSFFKLKKKQHNTSASDLQHKLATLKGQLSFLESRIGEGKLNMFKAKEIPRRDESLFEIWTSITIDIRKLQDEVIALNTPEEDTNPLPLPSSNEVVTPESAFDEDFILNDVVGDLPIGEVLELDLPVSILETSFELNPTSTSHDIPSSSAYTSHDIHSSSASTSHNIHSSSASTSHDIHSSSASTSHAAQPDIHQPSTSITQPVEPFSYSSTDIQDSSSILIHSMTILQDQSVVECIESDDVHRNVYQVTPDKPCKPCNELLPCVPSPFKRALFWPDVKPTGKKRLPKEKIPSVITSEAWKSYYVKKEDSKKEVIRQKELRKLKREQAAEAKKENLLRKGSKGSKKRRSINDEDEFEESVDDISPEPSPAVLTQPTPISDPAAIRVGQWVVVPYKVGSHTNKFIGQIVAVNHEESVGTVKFLAKKDSKYIWPTVEDIDYGVPINEIMFLLNEPHFDRWGYLSFSEDLSCLR